GWAVGIGDDACAREPVGAVDIHATGTTDTFTTRPAKSERRIDLVLNPDKRIEHHWSTIVEVDFKSIDGRIPTGVGIVSIDIEGLVAARLARDRPSTAALNARRSS